MGKQLKVLRKSVTVKARYPSRVRTYMFAATEDI